MSTVTVGHSPISLSAALSFIAGITDVTSWILLGGVFTSHITGNIVVVAADVVAGTPPHLAAVLALPLFVVITVGATLVTRRLGSRPDRVRRALLRAQAVLLATAAVLSFFGSASAEPQGYLALTIGLCAVAAMAAQNAYLHLGEPSAVSAAVMTGNLVAATIAATDLIARHGAPEAARAHWNDTWPLLAGFVAGCLVGAGSSTLLADHASIVPAVLAIALLGPTAFRSAPATEPAPTR